MARAQTAPLKNMQRELANLNRQMNQLGALGGKIDSDYQKTTTTFSKFDAKMRAVGGSILAVTAALAGLSAAIGAALKKSTDAAVDFDAAMRNVNSIARLSEESYANLVQETLALGGSQEVGGKSARELADALYQVFSSGIGIKETATDVQNISQALEVAKLSALGARAGLAQTKETAKAFLGVINAYKLAAASPAELAHVMDVLFETVNRGVVEFPELSQSLGVVVGIAAQAGVSIEELGAVIAHTTRRGEVANRVMYGMGQLLLEILTPTKDQREAMALLAEKTGRAGLEMSATALKAMGFSAWLQNVAEAAAEAVTAEEDVMDILVKVMPSARAARIFFALATDQATEFRTMVEDMHNASNLASGAMKGMGATEAALAQQALSAQFSLDVLSAAMHRASVMVGDVMRPQVGAFAQGMTGLVDAFSSLRPEVHAFAVNVGIGLVSFLGLAAAVGGFLLIVGPLTLGITTLAGPVLVLVQAVGVAIVAFVAWEKNLLNVRDEINKLLALVPGFLAELQDVARKIVIGIELGPVPAPIEGLRRLREGPEAAVAPLTAIGKLEEALGPPGGVAPATGPWQAFGAALRAVWDGIVSGIAAAWAAITPIFAAIGGGLGRIGEALAPLPGQFIEWFMSLGAVQAVSEALGKAWDALWGALKTAWNFLVPVFKAVMDTLQPIVVTLFDGIVSAIGKVRNAFGNVLGPVIKALGPTFEALGKAFKILWDFLEPGLKVLAQAFGVLVVLAIGVFVGVLSAAAAAIGPIIETIGVVVVAGLTIVIGVFKLVAAVWTGLVDIVVALVHGNWAGAWEAAKTLFKNVWDAIGTIAQGMTLLLFGIIEGLAKTVLALIGGFIEGFIGFFKNLFDRLVGKSIVRELVDGMVALFTELVTAVPKLIGGMVGSVLGKIGELKDSVLGKLGDLLGAVRSKAAEIAGAAGAAAAAPAATTARQTQKAGLTFAGTDFGDVAGREAALVAALPKALAGAIDSGAGAAADAATEMAEGVVVAATNTLRISSASRVFQALGHQVAAGFATGIELGAALVDDAIGRLVGAPLGGLVTEARLTVAVDVTSSDGSVNALQLDQVRQVAEAVLGTAVRSARRRVRGGLLPVEVGV